MTQPIEKNCPGRKLPECQHCARFGPGDYQAMIHDYADGKQTKRRCLSFRRKGDASRSA